MKFQNLKKTLKILVTRINAERARGLSDEKIDALLRNLYKKKNAQTTTYKNINIVIGFLNARQIVKTYQSLQ